MVSKTLFILFLLHMCGLFKRTDSQYLAIHTDNTLHKKVINSCAFHYVNTYQNDMKSLLITILVLLKYWRGAFVIVFPRSKYMEGHVPPVP